MIHSQLLFRRAYSNYTRNSVFPLPSSQSLLSSFSPYLFMYLSNANHRVVREDIKGLAWLNKRLVYDLSSRAVECGRWRKQFTYHPHPRQHHQQRSHSQHHHHHSHTSPYILLNEYQPPLLLHLSLVAVYLWHWKYYCSFYTYCTTRTTLVDTTPSSCTACSNTWTRATSNQ